ncbi:uncharacterized protein LOC142178190 [Nicotiana tabacum]|uniref:Uncharacterized protein LOC142178190 n=1 Tax=Nicotiana tabacum TaxID=4097 RepID=A0AC58U2B8_TOBAC
MGHRLKLPLSHKWRNVKDSFDGTKEKRLPPKICSGIEILNQLQDLEGIQLTKDPKKRKKISHENRKDNWNKKRKTNDTIKTRLDLQDKNIRPELHPIQRGEKVEVPTTCYTLPPEAKHKLCQFLKNLKVPDGFSCNISQCMNLKDHKISGLKSHDCHVLLQHILPLALRGMLSKEVCESLIELSLFFNVLGSKKLRIDDLEQIEAQIPITLCKLEKVFPPSFFDVMVHLPIHLVSEAKIAGPTHYRWMYHVERWLYFLKSLIDNRACPEGSIEQGYIANECMTLCSRYLHTIDTKFNRPERNYDGGLKKSNGGLSMFYQPGRTLGAKDPFGENDQDSENINYYGILTDVIELQFLMGRRVILFRCNWFDMYNKIKGVKKDEYDFVSINLGRFLKTNEPFVLAEQASRVFYTIDNFNKGWHVVRKTQPRDSYEIVKQIDDDIVDIGNPSQKKRKTTVKLNMKPSRTENEVESTIKTTTRYAFLAPGAIRKGQGRGRGLRSLVEKENMPIKSLFPQSSDLVKQYIQTIETVKIF